MNRTAVGLVPAITFFLAISKTWMPGTSPGMTQFYLLTILLRPISSPCDAAQPSDAPFSARGGVRPGGAAQGHAPASPLPALSG